MLQECLTRNQGDYRVKLHDKANLQNRNIELTLAFSFRRQRTCSIYIMSENV